VHAEKNNEREKKFNAAAIRERSKGNPYILPLLLKINWPGGKCVFLLFSNFLRIVINKEYLEVVIELRTR
jgi:hypothetical protein